ncbi:hypothetical protein PCANC_06869 [Puccinia coronata f. sp. avenae]|uniref:AN1-type domain-containing protein n=1 Tax=Puccinia coronata f. sp. avenae TaxID=200324 RepID=A0A2N5VVF4_9BASI|nr:hypothetical protein PCASD_07243 [Puccinia coronata f. sp. avenae]PLW53973.1 hypothetical protein PCANC_06869 [Puccinia coronata f. sp. avenae]
MPSPTHQKLNAAGIEPTISRSHKGENSSYVEGERLTTGPCWTLATRKRVMLGWLRGGYAAGGGRPWGGVGDGRDESLAGLACVFMLAPPGDCTSPPRTTPTRLPHSPASIPSIPPLPAMAPQLLLSLPFPGSPTMVLAPPSSASTSSSSHSSSSNSSSSRETQILESVCLQNQLPLSFASHLRLSRAGRPWDGSLLDNDLLNQPFLTAEVAMRLRGGGPKKRCQHAKNSVTESQCSQPALRLVGDCPHCTLPFCSRHRLPEDHACLNMSSCREAAFAKNKAKLESERTVVSKMVGA